MWRVCHPAMFCDRLYVHPGILHMLFFLSFWFVSLLLWELLGGQQWHCLLFLHLVLLWYILIFYSFVQYYFIYFAIVTGKCHSSFIAALTFTPFPLYSLFISPSSQLCGIFSFVWTCLIMSRSMFLVSWSASVKISFGIWSGPKRFFLIGLFIAAPISLFVIGSCSGSGVLYFSWNSFIVFVTISVDAWHSVVPGHA